MLIDADALRDYMLDYCGAAAFSGLPAAMVDAVDVARASDGELIEIAERLGVNPCDFAIDADDF